MPFLDENNVRLLVGGVLGSAPAPDRGSSNCSHKSRSCNHTPCLGAPLLNRTIMAMIDILTIGKMRVLGILASIMIL